jgi:hypothetical protein
MNKSLIEKAKHEEMYSQVEAFLKSDGDDLRF